MTAQQRKLLAVIQGLTLRRPVATSEIVRYLTSEGQCCEGLNPVYSKVDQQDSTLSSLIDADLAELHRGGFIEVFEGTVQCTRRVTTS